MNVKNAINNALQWLLSSGIQNIGNNDLEGNSLSGSFNSWFDLHSKAYPFVYSEITGYALTLLAYDGGRSSLENAVKAGNWLINVSQLGERGFICLFSHQKNEFIKKREEVYTFDTGVIVNGLVNLYRTTQNKAYLQAAKNAANWMVSVQQKDGSLPSRFSLEYQVIPASQQSWSTVVGSFHAKTAMGMLNLFDITKDERYKNFATSVCDHALKFQTPEGRFNTYGRSSGIDGTNLHPHCYSAEGLLCSGLYLRDERYIQAALRATEWIFKNQKDKAVTPRLYAGGNFNYNERTDIIAQSLRLFVLMDHLGYLPRSYKENIEKTAEHLLSLQYQNDEDAQKGGFIFGALSTGEKARHINSWCTMFAAQALKMYHGGVVNREVYRLLV